MTELTIRALIGVMAETEASETRALREACSKVGGQWALTRLLGLKSQGSISGWLATGRVPAEWTLDVERVSGVSRIDLRPDLYPPGEMLVRTKKRIGR